MTEFNEILRAWIDEMRDPKYASHWTARPDDPQYVADMAEEHSLGSRFPAALQHLVSVGTQIRFPDGEVRTVRRITPNGLFIIPGMRTDDEIERLAAADEERRRRETWKDQARREL